MLLPFFYSRNAPEKTGDRNVTNGHMDVATPRRWRL